MGACVILVCLFRVHDNTNSHSSVKSYLNTSDFTLSQLTDQLEYHSFAYDQAVYSGIWNVIERRNRSLSDFYVKSRSTVPDMKAT